MHLIIGLYITLSIFSIADGMAKKEKSPRILIEKTAPIMQVTNSHLTAPNAFDLLMVELCRERGAGYEYAGKKRLCANFFQGD